MIENLCRAPAILAGIEKSEAAGYFAAEKARNPAYRDRVERALVHMLDRIADAPAMPGEERERFGTCRGLAKILRIGKSAAHEVLMKFKALDLFAHKPYVRRRDSPVPSPTPGSNRHWWKPTIWRMGPAMVELMSLAARRRMRIALAPLGSRNRTGVDSKASGEIAETPNGLQDQTKKDVAEARPVSMSPVEAAEVALRLARTALDGFPVVKTLKQETAYLDALRRVREAEAEVQLAGFLVSAANPVSFAITHVQRSEERRNRR